MKHHSNRTPDRFGWYVFFTLAFGLVMILSLVASVKLTALQADQRSYAKQVK